MERKLADANNDGSSANQNAEDATVNARLNDVILANAVKVDAAPHKLPHRTISFIEALRATVGLIGLLFAAYFYVRLTKNEA